MDYFIRERGAGGDGKRGAHFQQRTTEESEDDYFQDAKDDNDSADCCSSGSVRASMQGINGVL